MILQDLEFADCAVRDLKDDRPIVGQELDMPRPGFVDGHQVTDAVLDLTQQRRMRGIVIVEEIDPRQIEIATRPFGIVKGIELAHEIPALTPPGSQQRICVVVHLLGGDG